MSASCSICRNVFTGIYPESVYSTPCGHIFHYDCLMKSLKRSTTCPFCRSKVTDKQVIKLYLNNNSNLSEEEDISSLTHQVQLLLFQNSHKDKIIKKLLKERKKEKNDSILLKKHAKNMEDTIRGHRTFVAGVREHIHNIRFAFENHHFHMFETINENIRKDIAKYQS